MKLLSFLFFCADLPGSSEKRRRKKKRKETRTVETAEVFRENTPRNKMYTREKQTHSHLNAHVSFVPVPTEAC